MRALVAFGMTALAALAVSPLAVSPVAAQQMPFIGAPVTGPTAGDGASSDDSLHVGESAVGIIDPALPRTMLRVRGDLGYNFLQPMRAEYFMARGGLPLTPGLPLPESRIASYQDLAIHAEFAALSFVSVFVETPMRWLNPDVNANTYGYGDMNFGFKLCTWNTEEMLATIQVRLYNPTAQRPGLGTDHWTIEPALLGIWKPYDNLMLEGEVRYFVPIATSSDVAGNVLRYGLGLSYGQVSQGFWYKPVVEGVGWTVVSGKTLVLAAPDAYTIRDADGQTIVNGYLGLRFGFGSNIDFYTGYGRCFTGNSWARDFVRLEMRLMY
jgi:hypothetical protein